MVNEVVGPDVVAEQLEVEEEQEDAEAVDDDNDDTYIFSAKTFDPKDRSRKLYILCLTPYFYVHF